MRNLVSFMHISLDGFAAGPKGEMNWIKINEEIFSYIGKRLDRVDTALYGRHTYEMMESYWPMAAQQPGASAHDIEHAKWYKKAKKLVLSRTMPVSTRPDLRVIPEVGREVSELKNQPGSDIFIFGSPSTVRSLRAANLIDEYWLFVSPVLLGSGVSVFEDVAQLTPLTLLENNVLSEGVLNLHYRVSSPGAGKKRPMSR